MHKIILHIGYPKTATTTLQKNIFPKIRNLDYVEGALYPSGNIEKGCLQGKEKVLLSNERVLGLKDKYEGKGKSLKNNFAEENVRVVVLLTIRSQIDMIKSIFTFYYGLFEQEGYSNINKMVLGEIGENGKMGIGGWLNYENVIRQFEDVFGKKNIHVLKYEDFSNEREDFYEGLSRVTGESCEYIEAISGEMTSYNVQPKKDKKRYMKPSKIYTWISFFKSTHLSEMKPVSEYPLGSYFKSLVSSFNKEVKMNERSKNIILSRYSDANSRLFDGFSLKRYGEYPMSESL